MWFIETTVDCTRDVWCPSCITESCKTNGYFSATACMNIELHTFYSVCDVLLLLRQTRTVSRNNVLEQWHEPVARMPGLQKIIVSFLLGS